MSLELRLTFDREDRKDEHHGKKSYKSEKNEDRDR